MAITAVKLPLLAAVRQLEALAGRAWVAEHVSYDRTWACCLTPDYPCRRLNSVTPLDPADDDDVPGRIAALCRQRKGGVLALRQTPLMAQAIIDYCAHNGWRRSTPVRVLCADAGHAAGGAGRLAETVSEADYVAASLAVCEAAKAPGKPFSALLQRVRGQKIPFVCKRDGAPIASMLAVREGGFAGIVDFTVDSRFRRQGVGRAFLGAGLRALARMQVARVWLHAGADHAAALQLCRPFGFAPCYDYAYWSLR